MTTYVAIRSFDDDLVVGTFYARVETDLTAEQVSGMLDGTPVTIDGVEYFLEDLPGYAEIGFEHGVIHTGTKEGHARVTTEAEIPHMLHVRVEWRKLASPTQ